jgi:hypothetical protein
VLGTGEAGLTLSVGAGRVLEAAVREEETTVREEEEPVPVVTSPAPRMEVSLKALEAEESEESVEHEEEEEQEEEDEEEEEEAEEEEEELPTKRELEAAILRYLQPIHRQLADLRSRWPGARRSVPSHTSLSPAPLRKYFPVFSFGLHPMDKTGQYCSRAAGVD